MLGLSYAFRQTQYQAFELRRLALAVSGCCRFAWGMDLGETTDLHGATLQKASL
jgi:hypothetical protein